VTAPHKAAAAARADRARLGEHARRPRRAVEGYSTDTAILDGLPLERPAILGSGGCGAAFGRRSRTRASSRAAATGPRTCRCRPRRQRHVRAGRGRSAPAEGQTLIDLPYPETATGRRAREAGATVITGSEVLVAQGAASFELWTGMPAPVEVMRAAVGLAP
jgi:hypothetical protein